MSDTGKENRLWMETDETARQRIEQAQRLKEHAHQGGLRFETYLPPSLAEWVLEMVEQGVFVDPSEAVFVFMEQAKDIDPHDDLKREVLKRRLEQGLDDTGGGRVFTSDELKAHMKKHRDKKTEPAVWEKISHEV